MGFWIKLLNFEDKKCQVVTRCAAKRTLLWEFSEANLVILPRHAVGLDREPQKINPIVLKTHHKAFLTFSLGFGLLNTSIFVASYQLIPIFLHKALLIRRFIYIKFKPYRND